MRYYFHLTQDGHEMPDDIGTELPDAAAARSEALETLCGLTAERISVLTPPSALVLRITAEGGQHLGILSLTFEEVPPDWSSPGKT